MENFGQFWRPKIAKAQRGEMKLIEYIYSFIQQQFHSILRPPPHKYFIRHRKWGQNGGKWGESAAQNEGKCRNNAWNQLHIILCN